MKVKRNRETQSKFQKPVISDKNKITINTAALQESHLSLGTHDVPWVSTNRYFLTQ